jgi:hypothetical protein
MTGELEKRASDGEREQVVMRLRDASAEGRLTLEELADRTALAYGATTHAELVPLTSDLPATAAPTAPAAGRRRRWLIGVFARSRGRAGARSGSGTSCSRSSGRRGSTFGRRSSPAGKP